MSDGGKGDKPRPLSIPKEEFDNRWENIFGKKKKTEDNTGTDKNTYQDILSTEDCLQNETGTDQV
jgi:hypothetical protein